MDYGLSEEQAMLRDAARELLTDHAPARAQLRGDDVDPTLWALTATQGWPGLIVPEEFGGSGLGLIELTLLAEEIGGAVTRGPFVSTALVGLALARGGSPALQAEVLPSLAAGSAWATWAFAEPRSPWTAEGIRGTTARIDGDDAVLDGVKTAVPEADGASWLLITAREWDGLTSFLVERDTPGVSVRRQQVLDQTRAFYEVRLDGVRVPLRRRLAAGPADLQELLDDAAVLTAADTLGALDRLLGMTIEHLRVRVQFGRPLGSFQALKHKCATMAMAVHGVRAATYHAAMAADAGSPDAERAACVAASYASAAAGDVAGEALQLHGGIGFTWEHDLHLYLRRAQTDAVLHGDVAQHRDRLCDLIRA